MLYIASDHAGYQLKKELKDFLAKKMNQPVEDLGPAEYEPKDDFVDYAVPLAKKVAAEKDSRGILICSSGQGMCIAANKIKGVRAIIGYSISGTEIGRRHNNANILCLAARVLSQDHAEAITKKFLETEFDGDERFVRRNRKIEEIE